MSRSWGWVGQYGMAIGLALLLGFVLSRVPLFQQTLVAHDPQAADHRHVDLSGIQDLLAAGCHSLRQ